MAHCTACGRTAQVTPVPAGWRTPSVWKSCARRVQSLWRSCQSKFFRDAGAACGCMGGGCATRLRDPLRLSSRARCIEFRLSTWSGDRDDASVRRGDRGAGFSDRSHTCEYRLHTMAGTDPARARDADGADAVLRSDARRSRQGTQPLAGAGLRLPDLLKTTNAGHAVRRAPRHHGSVLPRFSWRRRGCWWRRPAA